MILHISHETVYEYDQPVPYGLQQIRQTPRTGPTQTVLEWSTDVEGRETELTFDDQYRNVVQLLSLGEGRSSFRLLSSGTVETVDTGGIQGPEAADTVPLWVYRRSTGLTTAGRRVGALVEAASAPLVDVTQLHELSERVRAAVEYRTGSTTVTTQAEDVLEHGEGVCQDHAHVFISAARFAGLSARYVSGYLMMNDRVDQDASHAWAEVHVPGLGWVGFDVSNGISPDERYVRIAVGLDYAEAAPVSGIRFGNAAERLEVSVQVQQ